MARPPQQFRPALRIARVLRRAFFALLVAAPGPGLAAPAAGPPPAGAPAPGPAAPVVPALRWVARHWTTRDGLPVNSITDVLQTRDGYIWVATFDGLVRFDGARFQRFDQSTSPALSSNRVLALRETGAGTLWALTQSGDVTWFEQAAAGRIASPSLAETGGVSVIEADATGGLWLGARNGLWRVRGKRAERFAPRDVPGPITEVTVDRAGGVWAAGPWGVAHVPAAGAAERFAPPGDGSTAVNGLYELDDGRLLVGTSTGLFVPAAGRLAPLDPRSLAARSEGVRATHGLLADSTSTRVLAAAFAVPARTPEPTYLRGLRPCVMDREGHAWSAADATLLVDGAPALTLDDEITRLATDREGGVWAGTAAEGLYRVARARVAVVADSAAGGPNGVYGMAIDRAGTLWMASFVNGLGWWKDGKVGGFTGKGPMTTTVATTRDGRILVGTYTFGLGEVVGERIVPVAPAVFGPGRIVSVIHEDRAGDLWVGTDLGLFRQSHGAWTHYDESSGLPNRRVRTCLERADGSLWFGTNGGGIALFDGGRFRALDGKEGLPTGLVRGMHEDDRGVVWVATEGRGLARIELPPGAPVTSARVRVYGRRDGLFDETLHAVLEDARHDLWISSNRGIFRVRRDDLDRYRPGGDATLRCRVFDESNGMPSREGNGGVQDVALRDAAGRLWFATQAGVVTIDPPTVEDPQAPPDVVIETATSELAQLPLGAGAVDVGPRERDLNLSFTSLSFVNPHDLRFRYRLVGHDNDWVAAGERREAFYSQLPPGRYRFEVAAAASDGPWSPAPATLTIVARAYFWETWWFRVLLGALVVAAGLALFRARITAHARRERELSHEVASRTATIEAQAGRLRAQDEAKTRFFADVSHEFRTPLTLTIGPIEDLLAGAHGPLPPDAAEQLEMALRNSRRALRQVNRLLDLAKLEAGAMRIAAGPGDATARVREMVETFRPQAERKGVVLMGEWPAVAPIVWFDPQLLEQAVANLLSNAVKFTPPGGTITVEARVEDGPAQGPHPGGWFAIVVCDSGPGIPEEERRHVFERFHQVAGARSRLAQGTGIGLSLTRQIVELHGGRVELASTVGEGSAFTIRLPLGRAHLDASMLAPPGEDASSEPVPPWLFADAAPRPAAGATTPTAEDAQTLLVIEDDEDVRQYLVSLLAPHFRVVTAQDGAQGLAFARQAPPDCIVSDVMMPGMDGYALCRAVKSDPELEFVPIVLLTARASSDHRLEGLSLGADDYLAKPFHAPELLLRIRNLIAVRRGLREKLRPRELHARPIAATAADDVFLAQVRQAIEERMADETLTVNALAEAIGYERSRLYRRLREAAGATPEALIKQFRLERAAQLLTARAGTVSEIAYAVGFKSVTHFCKVFKDRYGTSPGTFSAPRQSA